MNDHQQLALTFNARMFCYGNWANGHALHTQRVMYGRDWYMFKRHPLRSQYIHTASDASVSAVQRSAIKTVCLPASFMFPLSIQLL